ncbi:MAG TPA: CHAD domain-containing protein [Hanamia sp.]|nr:CHAD domain-containing protein [Hanamia sp.]
MEALLVQTDLSDYFREKEKNILEILIMPANEFKKEDYHRLRVEIKKLKALLELINYCCEGFQKRKFFKPFAKIFNQSGKIRELQLEESVLESYDVAKIEKYVIKVKKDIKKNQDSFQLLISQKRKRTIKKTFKKMDPYPKELPTIKVNAFIAKEKREINKLILQNSLKPLNLHDLRKIVKIDLYTKKSLHLGDKNELEIENNFQELLGKWHDCRTINNLLEKSIVKKNIRPEELKQLLQINEEIRANTRQLSEEINNKVEFKTLFV